MFFIKKFCGTEKMRLSRTKTNLFDFLRRSILREAKNFVSLQVQSTIAEYERDREEQPNCRDSVDTISDSGFALDY